MAATDDEVVAQLIHRIQVYAFPRRLRSREFFVNFDTLKCGRVTKTHFGRALNTLGVRLRDEEVELLAEHFTEVGPKIQKPQNVNYKKFCEAIDEIFIETDLGFKAPGEADQFGRSSNGFNEQFKASLTSFHPNAFENIEDEEKIDHIMHRLATLCSSRGICFKFLYYDCDRGPSPSPSQCCPRRGGKCTKNQFIRYFPFKKEFSEDDIEKMVQRYTTQTGDVHFQAIHNDISEVLSPEPPPFPTSDLVLKPDPTTWDHMELNPVRKIQSKVVERRIRLSDFFRDFDPLRKGFCTAGQLKTVLTVSNLEREIDRNDFNHIVDVYTREDGQFCWKLFVRDIDSAFSVPGLEKDPLATTSLPDATTTAPGRRNHMKLTSHQRNKFNKLEDKLRSRIVKRRILTKPAFKDMDKSNKMFVTRNQFMRVMGTLGFDLTLEEVAILSTVYCDRGNHNDFNYVDFIKSCDPPFYEEEVAMSQLCAPYQDQAPSKYFATSPLAHGGKIHPLDRAYSSPSL